MDFASEAVALQMNIEDNIDNLEIPPTLLDVVGMSSGFAVNTPLMQSCNLLNVKLMKRKLLTKLMKVQMKRKLYV